MAITENYRHEPPNCGRQTEAPFLVIDDDEQIRNLLKHLLSDEYECTVADSAEGALAVLNARSFNLVTTDIGMGGSSGLQIGPAGTQQTADIVAVMTSGQNAIDYAIESMRVGAFEYITKPVVIRNVESAVRRTVLQQDISREKRLYQIHLEQLVEERTAERAAGAAVRSF